MNAIDCSIRWLLINYRKESEGRKMPCDVTPHSLVRPVVASWLQLAAMARQQRFFPGMLLKLSHIGLQAATNIHNSKCGLDLAWSHEQPRGYPQQLLILLQLCFNHCLPTCFTMPYLDQLQAFDIQQGHKLLLSPLFAAHCKSNELKERLAIVR